MSVGASARTRQNLWRVAFVATLAVAMWVALLPPGDRPDWFPHADKLRHAVAFAALWWLGHHLRWRSPWRLAAVLLAFGIGVEVAQGFTAYRDASAADVMADMVGIALGALIWRRRAGMGDALASG